MSPSEYADLLASLERQLEQAKVDRNRAVMDARNPLLARIAELETTLDDIALIMQRPASNHRFMQIAEPARRVINMIKRVKASSHE